MLTHFGRDAKGRERGVGGVRRWGAVGIVGVGVVWGVGLYLAQGAQLGETLQFFRAASGGSALMSSVM